MEAGLSQRQIGLIILLGGAILLLISALADPLGIGGGGKFGGKQIAGVAVGAVGVLVGALLAVRSSGGAAGDRPRATSSEGRGEPPAPGG